MDTATAYSTLKALANNSAYTDAQLDAAIAAALADVGQSRFRPTTTANITFADGAAHASLTTAIAAGLTARVLISATIYDLTSTAGAMLTTTMDVKTPDEVSALLRDDDSESQPTAIAIDTKAATAFCYPVPDDDYTVTLKFCVAAAWTNLPNDIAQIVLSKGAFAYLMAPSDEQRKGSATYRDWQMWLAGPSEIEDGETAGAEITMSGSWDTIDPDEYGAVGS